MKVDDYKMNPAFFSTSPVAKTFYCIFIIFFKIWRLYTRIFKYLI